MYNSEQKRVAKLLKKMYRKGILTEKSIWIFGVSDNTRQIIQMLRDLGVEPAGILDNDPAKQDSFCARIRVYPVDFQKVHLEKSHIFLVYSFFWKEMVRQLQSLMVSRENICCLYQKKKGLPRQFWMAWRGRRICHRLFRIYGELPVFLCPYTGTGDIYLIGTFWKQYLRAAGIENYIFLVISSACKKTAEIFDIRNVELLRTQEEGEYLIKYYMLCPDEICLKLLNDSWGQIRGNPLQWFRGYRGLYFMELFRTFVFNLPDDALPERPVLKDAGDELDRIFEKYQLTEGKTVLLSPYANTLADLPDDFWVLLAKKLMERGYRVCTNSSGEKEPAVKGTVPVFFPLNIAPQFVERAGYFIGVRSGFCDVISAAEARKIILYDRENRFFNSSAYAYFSLNHMGLCHDAVEIEFENRTPYIYIEMILHALTGTED